MAFDGTYLGDDPIHPRADLSGLFAPGASISKNLPTRCCRVDLVWRQSFVAPIIPLDQIGFTVRCFLKSSQYAGLSRSLQWACQSQAKRFLGQDRPQESGHLSSAFR